MLFGGGLELLGIQVVGVAATAVWVSLTTVVMFAAVKALGVLRIPAKAEEYGIDIYEHGTTVWPDMIPNPEDVAVESGVRSTAPAVGD
jgi:Amt family ammonium transporter